MTNPIDAQMQDKQMTNQVFRNILVALEQVVGADNMKKILTSAGLPQFIGNYPPSNNGLGHKATYNGAIHKAVYDIYGERGATSILEAAGRVQAEYGIQQYGALVGIVRVALGILPMHRKVRIVLDNIARVINEEGGSTITITESDGVFYWDNPLCPQCYGITSHSPVCAAAKGSTMHGVLGMIPNAPIKVEEVECKAKGDATCKYRITLSDEAQPKQPNMPKPI